MPQALAQRMVRNFIKRPRFRKSEISGTFDDFRGTLLMQRRDFFAAAGAGLAGAGVPFAALAQEASAPEGPEPGSYAWVVAQARELSAAPYEHPTAELTGPFADLDFDRYRAIHSKTVPIGPERQGFAIDLLPPGFIFKDPVGISLVTAEGVRDIPFSLEVFDFAPELFDPAALAAWTPSGGIAFSGFRLRHGINRPDYQDEFVVFQGASYFRATARNMIYGLSARGLAIRTGDPRGEEFPIFRHFWIEQPPPGAKRISVRALLDSESCAGAFEFDISPGETTSMGTRCTLFPRVALEEVGVAPLTSMFLFGPQWPRGTDDFRNAVHDSEGLQMITGHGERLWRPLTNPLQLQISAFQDAAPRAFGLSQRRREFTHYQDDEAGYEKRPTAWIEPSDAWGEGAVVLVEIPTQYEVNDNVVSFWRPKEALTPTESGHQFNYWLHWCAMPPDAVPLARVHATRTGRSVRNADGRVMVVDFLSERCWNTPPQVEATASQGEIANLTVRALPGDNITRVSFGFSPAQSEVLEFQMALIGSEGPASERWIYRWTPA
jgi:glucans biosynthesis protein